VTNRADLGSFPQDGGAAGPSAPQRQAYHPPRLRDHGTLRAVTHGDGGDVYIPDDAPTPYVESAGVS
jgi:hypothetical protein